MAIQFCAVPLKLRKTCPGMDIRIVVCKNIKRYSVVTLSWQWTVTPRNSGHPIFHCSTKIEEDMPGYGDMHRCFQKYKKVM